MIERDADIFTQGICCASDWGRNDISRAVELDICIPEEGPFVLLVMAWLIPPRILGQVLASRSALIEVDTRTNLCSALCLPHGSSLVRSLRTLQPQPICFTNSACVSEVDNLTFLSPICAMDFSLLP
jgi:hypothetical protein